MTITNRKRAFIEHYLAHWNASEAARLAGYSEKTAGSQGARLLKDVEIQKAITERLAELTATADEVKQRLTSHARGSMADFLDGERISIDQARTRGQLHLIKKYKVTRRLEPGDEPRATIETIELDLYDSQSALEKIGRALGLFVDRQEVTGAGGTPLMPISFIEAVPPAPAAQPAEAEPSPEEIGQAGGA